MARSEQWLDDFSSILESLDEGIRKLVLDGSIEICPVCGELSAYAWADTDAYDQFEDVIPGGFQPETGKIAHIGKCSCWEWECGHCGAHLVGKDSPINHPAYTHSED